MAAAGPHAPPPHAEDVDELLRENARILEELHRFAVGT